MKGKEPRSAVFVRMPVSMKEWLDAKVEANFSSQNSEILRCIRDKMEREAVNEVAA